MTAKWCNFKGLCGVRIEVSAGVGLNPSLLKLNLHFKA